jgi:hypothetical protein
MCGFDEGGEMKRRDFLVGGAVSAGGAASGFFGSALLRYLSSSPDTPWKVLSAEEARRIDELAGEIIPCDEISGGAREAKVVRFIDWQFAPGAPYENELGFLRESLAKAKGMAAGEIEKKFPAFFKRFVMLVNQGYYGHPNHGGNSGYLSWRAAGIDAPTNTGRNVPGKENHL